MEIFPQKKTYGSEKNRPIKDFKNSEMVKNKIKTQKKPRNEKSIGMKEWRKK